MASSPLGAAGWFQVLVLEELHENTLEVQVCRGVKIEQEPPDQSDVLSGT